MVTPFFPRGDGPLISVLTATRGRPAKLLEAINSCLDLAEDKTLLEFIFKVDNDDAQTIDTLEDWDSPPQHPKSTKIISSRGNGYKDLHLFYNQMAEKASGDWLMFFNDDAKIITQGWDKIILNIVLKPAYPGIFNTCVLFPPSGSAFFWMRRNLFKLLGHMSMDHYVDAWVDDVVHMAGVGMGVPIEILHQKDNHTQCIPESQRSFSLETKRQRLRDCEILLNYLEACERMTVWTDRPEGTGWHVWRVKEDNSSPVPVFINNDGKYLTIERFRLDIASDSGKWCKVNHG